MTEKTMLRLRCCVCLLAGLLAFSVAGCGSSSTGSGKTVRLNGAGATFIYPMMSKWGHEYEKAKGVLVNYQSIGSGGGIQQMTAQTVDFGCSEGPLNEEQLKKAGEVKGEVVHIPLAMGATVPVYNLDEVKETLQFSGPVLADIFLGKIKKWSDPALKELNPNVALPDKDIVVVHRSEGSGTTYIWSDYLSKVSPEWKEKVGVGTSLNWPIGIGQKGNEGVTGQVKLSTGSLGYVELTYAVQNQLKYGSVKNKEGAFVVPDLTSVTAAAASLKDIPADLRYSITDAPGKDAYPISGTTWAVVYTKDPGGKGKAVHDFLYWCTHDGQQLCEALHYSKLPANVVEKLEKRLSLIEPK